MITLEEILTSTGRDADPRLCIEAADQWLRDGDLPAAAIAFDRAFGLDPSDTQLANARSNVLDQVAVEEHGISFRHVPAGSFLMGSETGDEDEAPVHAVQLKSFWISDVPISWDTYCRIMHWEAPPVGAPRAEQDQQQVEGGFDSSRFMLQELVKIRLQYCEDKTTRAIDWHGHLPPSEWNDGKGGSLSARAIFGSPPRETPDGPMVYSTKPMVAVS